ncbi:hypothetical protein FEM48_Zijuj05G0143000 [Ziziphus jujuba var. spinosa]|uniref:MADS-box domain-containing protein n=1 Tax=Ziziphus jujuba var. spinosa TaxID=714518 RepID=A0A978VFB2_ZIZJJ|nr:hypothetical protein FEM48_Zijuj05G0143000 [Ziziphus jujuba var. spinosa]
MENGPTKETFKQEEESCFEESKTKVTQVFRWIRMGRVKLKLKRLENINGRQATYAKQKCGIMKNANELSILCDIDMVFLMFSPTGRPALVEGQHRNFGEVIEKFAQLSYCERMKRKLESLEALKKTFKKLDHDVNIDYFMDSSDFSGLRYVLNLVAVDSSNQLWELQAQLTGVRRRLSFWSNLNKIDDIGCLNQMEDMLRESIKGILLQKTLATGKLATSCQSPTRDREGSFVSGYCVSLHVRMIGKFSKTPSSFNILQRPDALSPNCAGCFGTSYCKKMEVGDTGKLNDIGHVDFALNESSTNSGFSVEHDKKYAHSSIITQFPNSMKLEPHERNLPVSPVAYKINSNYGPPGFQYDRECLALTSAS